MHELSLAENVVQLAQQAALKEGARRVRTVILEIGQLSHVAPEALEFCFASVAAGTLAEGAWLEIRLIAGEGCCQDCGATSPMPEPYGLCPACGSTRLNAVAGTEMRVKAIEIE